MISESRNFDEDKILNNFNFCFNKYEPGTEVINSTLKWS